MANLYQLSVQLIKPNYLLLIKGKLADIFLEYKHFSLNVSYPAFLFLIIYYFSAHSFIYSFFTHLSVFFIYYFICYRTSEQELSSMNWESLDSQTRSCEPVRNILFLKTHKTGSSTFTNILNRYGDKNDLIITLPVKSYLFHWPSSFRLSFVESTYGRPPNILCNHARYNKVPMNWLFPKETSRYITILRDPVMQFESVFNFFHLWYHFDGLQKAR